MTPDHTEQIFDQGEPDNRNQVPLIPAGYQIIVEKIVTRAKHIKVKIYKSDWRIKLSAQGKRPLGMIRKCDLYKT